MQVVFLLKTSLAIQNTISFAPRTLRLLPIHIPLHLPQRDKKREKVPKNLFSPLKCYVCMSNVLMCDDIECFSPASLLCILGSCVHLSFRFQPFSCASLFVRSGFLCARTCVRVLPREVVFFCCHICHTQGKNM